MKIEANDRCSESIGIEMIATQFAGNRQQSRFLALVSNKDLLQQNLDVAAESEDTGTIQALKALDSLESKLNQVQVAYQQFYTTIGVESVWKTALDGIKNFINTLNSLPKAFGKIPLGAITIIANVITTVKSIALEGLASIAAIWNTKVHELEKTQVDARPVGEKMVETARVGIESRAGELKAAFEKEVKEATMVDNPDKIDVAPFQQRLDDIINFSNANKGGNTEAILETRVSDLIEDIGIKAQLTNEQVVALQNSFGAGDINVFSAAFSALLDEINKAPNQIEQVTTRIKTFKESLKDYVKDSTYLSKDLTSFGQALNLVAGLIGTSSEKGRVASGGMMVLAGGFQAAGIAVKAFQAAMEGASFSIPWLGVATAAISIINGIATVIETSSEKLERLTNEAEKANNKYITKKDELKSLDNAINKYEELSKKQNESAEAKQNFIDAANELAKQTPELISGYDAEGNAIVDLTNKYILLANARMEAANAGIESARKNYQQINQQLIIDEQAIRKGGKNLNVQSVSKTNAASDLKYASLRDLQESFFNEKGNRSLSGNLAALAGANGASFTAFDFDENNPLPSLDNAFRNIKEQLEENEEEIDWGASNFTEDIQDSIKNWLKEGTGTFSEYLKNNGAITTKNVNALQENADTTRKYYLSLSELQARAASGANIAEIFEAAEQALVEYDNVVKELKTKEREGDQEAAKALEYFYDDESLNHEYLESVASSYSELRSALNQQVAARKQVIAAQVYSDYVKAINDADEGTKKLWQYYEDSTQGILMLNARLNAAFEKGEYSDPDSFIKSEEYEKILADFNKTFGEFWNNSTDSTREAFNTYYDNLGSYTREQARAQAEKLGLDFKNDGLDIMFEEADITQRIKDAFSSRNIAQGLKDSVNNLEHIPTTLEDQLKEVADKAESYARNNLGQNSTTLIQSYIDLITLINNLPYDQAAAISNVLSGTELSQSGILGLKKTLKDEFHIEDGPIIIALNSLSASLVENITAQLETITSSISENLKDTKANIEKMGSGLDFAEAQKIFDKISASDSSINFTDIFEFDKDLGNYVAKSGEMIQKYVEAENSALEEEYNFVKDSIEAAQSASLITVDNYETALASSSPERVAAQALGLTDELETIAKATAGTSEWKKAIKEYNDAFETALGHDQAALETLSVALQENKDASVRQALLAIGDYNGYLSNLFGKGTYDIEAMVKSRDFSIQGMKPFIEQVNGVYSQLIDDVLSKPLDEIKAINYKGLIGDEIDLGGELTDIIKRYAELAGKTTDETNDLIIQAIEKQNEQTIGAAADAIRNVTFTGKQEFASLDTIGELANAFDVPIENLIGEYNAALDAYQVDMSAISADKLEKIANYSNIVADSVANFLSSVVSAIGNGIQGKLDNAGRDNLISNLKQYNIELSDLDFTKTAEGLKLSEQAAIRLYQQISAIDALQGQIVFDELRKSLETRGSAFENISTTTAEVVRLQKELAEAQSKGAPSTWSDSEKAKIEKLEKELQLAQEIQRAQSQDPSQYDFMNRDLPDYLKGPQNYWNSVGEAYKVMNESAKSGYMEIDDFYNIVNEMSNLMAMSGSSIEFMGQTIDGSAESAAALIERGMGALSNIDGEGVKIDLSQLSASFQKGATDMGEGFDKAFQTMADSQIKMLDGMIRLLETVVAMEELGDIDLSGNNNGILELGELFEVSYEEDGQAFLKASEVAQKTAGHILKLAEDNDELNQDLDSVEFNNKTLRTILQDLQNGVIMSQEDAELYTSALNSLYQMVQSGEYDLDNLMTSVQEIAGKSGFVGEIKIDDAKIAIGYGVALEADNNGEYHIGTQTTTDPDKALNLAVLEGLGADLTNATFSGKGKDIEVTAPLTLGKQTVEVSSKEGEVTYKDESGEYSSLRELLDANWATLSDDEREAYGGSEEKFIEAHYSAEVLAQVSVGGVQITDEGDFKSRTQEQVKHLADSLVNGEQGAIIKAANDIGITVTTDIDGNISAETMQQLADIAGIDSKIVALSVATSVEGPISETSVNTLLGEEELPEKPITLNATLNDETGLLSGEDNEEPIPIEKEVLVTPTNIQLLSEGIEPKLEGELEPARVEQILVEILTAAFNAEETDFGDRIITLPDGETEVKVVDLIEAILTQVALKTSGDYDYSQEITLPGDAQLTLAEAFALLASLVLNWQEDPHIDSSAILPEGEPIDLGTREGKVTVSNVKVTYNSPELSEDILDRKLYAPEDGDWTQVQVSIAGAKTSVEEYVSAMQAAIENGNVLSALDLSNLMVLKEGNLIDQDTFDSIIDSLTALIEDSNALSTEAGNAIIEGLTAGTEESGPVGESIQTLTDLVETKLREGLGWHSPSTLAQEAGQSIVEGLAIGMEDPSIAISAAEALAQAIVDAIQTYFNTNPITYSLLGNTTQPTGTNDTSGTNSGSAQTSGAIDTSFLTAAIVETQNMMSIVGETFSKSAGEINNVAKSVESIKTDNVDAIQKAQNLIKHDKVDAIQTAQSNISNSKVLELQTAANSINPVPAQSARDAINRIKSTIEVGVNLTVNATGGTVTGVTGGTSLGTNKTNVKLTKQRGLAKAKGTKTLMGELGPELVVSNGHYFIAGANGPEMVDLAEDAIVFNHLQTADLLKKGKISTTGTPITNERKATSFATGNVGPAQASASSALAALKQIRQMWQSMLDASLKDLGGMASPSGGGGGGGGGGDTQKELEGIVAEIEEWYNWLKKIDDIQKQINIKQKEYNNLQKDRIANGKTIYTNLMDRVNLSRQEMEYHKGLVEAQQARYDEELAKMRSNDVFNALYQVDSNGIFQRAGDNAFANFVRAHGNASLADQLGTGSITITTEKAQTESEKNEGKEIEYESATITLPANGMEMLRDLVEQNANGETKYSANQQYEILKQLGFSDWLKYDTNGKALFEDANNPTQEEIQNAVSVFIERWDATPDYFDGLRDSIQEHKEAVLDLESEIYDIEQIIIDNQIDLENKVLKAIEDMRQAEIDALQDERDAYQDSVDAMVKGLNDALNKERQMYQNQQNQDELERLQRQLALAQRTGASGATIRNLQNQVQSKQQEIYFEERQQEIDAIQEAANQQIERLDRQIELMTETLAYQQENGLLWERVEEILKLTPEEITDFIASNTKEYQEYSALHLDQIHTEDMQSAQLYKAAVEDGFTASTAETIGNATSNKEEITNKIEETRSDIVSATNEEAAKREAEKKAASESSSGGGSSGGTTTTSEPEPEPQKTTVTASKDTTGKATYTAQQVLETHKDTTSKKAVQKIIDEDKAAGGTTKTTAQVIQTAVTKASSVLSSLKNNVQSLVKNTGATAKAAGAKGTNVITKPSGATVKFATGGLNTTPGLAWLDGTTAHPEYVLSADQTAFLRDELLNSRDSFHNIIGELQAVTQQIVNPSTFNTNNVSNDGVTIENINVTMQNNIANDYDVNRANDKFFDAMVKTARKAGYRNVSRR